MQIISYPSQAFLKLARHSQETPRQIQESVRQILEKVRKNGDQALTSYAFKFDGVKISSRQLGISRKSIAKAKVSKELQAAGMKTKKDVEAFARASLPSDWQRMNSHGASVGEKYDPIQRIGVYIPGGSVPLVSTVFMTVAIARVAGVPEIVVCSPPPISPEILWACGLCGATEVYQAGGAQAMAAMAYGTQTIKAVHKLFGPGNAYVTEAKRQLFGTVGIDLLAGPSELMILADETTRTEWAAADLLAQAEHGSGRERVFCVSHSRKVLDEIQRQVIHQSGKFRGNAGLQKVLKEGFHWVLVNRKSQVVEVANLLAPEHLQIMTRNARPLARKIVTAGGIFLGNHTPTVLGDFAAGPSHTLPTSGAGKSFSGLRVLDFVRRTSLVEYNPRSLGKARNGVQSFSRAEQLPAHGRSLEIRILQRT